MYRGHCFGNVFGMYDVIICNWNIYSWFVYKFTLKCILFSLMGVSEICVMEWVIIYTYCFVCIPITGCGGYIQVVKKIIKMKKTKQKHKMMFLVTKQLVAKKK